MDSSVSAVLFESNLVWAKRVARNAAKNLPPQFDRADLEQEARLEMWKQVQRFDPSRGVPFQAFAYRAVQGAAMMTVRRRHFRDATQDPLRDNHVDQRPRPDQALLEREERRNVTGPRERRQMAKVRAAMAELPAVEAHLVRRVHLEGADLEELEAVWGVRLELRLRAAVRTLKRALLPDLPTFARCARRN